MFNRFLQDSPSCTFKFSDSKDLLIVKITSSILLLLCLVTLGISLKNILNQQCKPIIVLFYWFTISFAGLTIGLMAYQIRNPESTYCGGFIGDITYHRLIATIIYVFMVGIYFLTGLSMIQLGFSFGIIFH